MPQHQSICPQARHGFQDQFFFTSASITDFSTIPSSAPKLQLAFQVQCLTTKLTELLSLKERRKKRIVQLTLSGEYFLKGLQTPRSKSSSSIAPELLIPLSRAKRSSKTWPGPGRVFRELTRASFLSTPPATAASILKTEGLTRDESGLQMLQALPFSQTSSPNKLGISFLLLPLLLRVFIIIIPRGCVNPPIEEEGIAKSFSITEKQKQTPQTLQQTAI
jgi:hypothetical protein